MKLSDCVNILKESRHWIVLLCISNAFFIFLAWVAYPEVFRNLVMMMIVFSLASLYVGILLERKKRQNHEGIFHDFLREPSLHNEKVLNEQVGQSHKLMVGDLANKLRKLNDELEESKLQTINYETFIESWIHEIKMPISLLTLVTENRKEEMSELVYQRVEHARIAINENVERILFYARLQAAHLDYRFNRISLGDVIEETLFELRPLLEEKEVQVVVQAEDIPVVTDEKVLQFIVGQVLVNAIKYANEQGERRIWIKTSFDKVNNQYYLEIADNGIGVLKSDLPFIFDKGMTGDHPNRKQCTGIGLYLVKKLCDELQIEIDVESEYGKGFMIRFLFLLNDKW